MEDLNHLTDPHTKVCAIALDFLTNNTVCPHTRMFAKLFLWDIIAINTSGNFLAMIQCALNFIENRDQWTYDTAHKQYALDRVNQEFDII